MIFILFSDTFIFDDKIYLFIKYNKKLFYFYIFIFLNNGDWGLGIGDWGLGVWGWGPIPNPQIPIPLPQPPIPLFKKNYLNYKIFLFIKYN